MGLGIDIIFCVFIGFICVLVAHFVFGIPTNNLKGIFFLGFIGGGILDYLGNKIESGSSALPMICGFLIVIGGGYFFILPLVSDVESDSDKIPVTINSIPDDSSSGLTQLTTVAPIEYYTRSYHWTYGRHSPTYTLQIPKPLY